MNNLRFKTYTELKKEFPSDLPTGERTSVFGSIFPFWGMPIEKCRNHTSLTEWLTPLNREMYFYVHDHDDKVYKITSHFVCDYEYIAPDEKGINGVRDNVHENSKARGNWATDSQKEIVLTAFQCLTAIINTNYSPDEKNRAIFLLNQIALDLAGRQWVDLSNIENV